MYVFFHIAMLIFLIRIKFFSNWTLTVTLLFLDTFSITTSLQILNLFIFTISRLGEIIKYLFIIIKLFVDGKPSLKIDSKEEDKKDLLEREGTVSHCFAIVKLSFLKFPEQKKMHNHFWPAVFIKLGYRKVHIKNNVDSTK